MWDSSLKRVGKAIELCFAQYICINLTCIQEYLDEVGKGW